MKISKQWLSEWVDISIDVDELAARLTMAGLEVDHIESLNPSWDDVRTGQILACEPHPQADRLQVCQVDVGMGESLQIVCGASNARKGLIAPVAMIGAKLGDTFKIKKAKLRGVESHGMLCSSKELGLSDETSGLMELPKETPIGLNLANWLELNDTVIEVDLTPNRGDCLSMMGIARETAVLIDASLKGVEIGDVAPVHNELFPIDLVAKTDCPRYVGRVIKGVDLQRPTPRFIQERLRRCGIRSLNLAVDITNYILLELGQPMHAFDLNRLEGGIQIRHAHQDEQIELLDGKVLSLDNETLVIADHTRAVALAGIMGGELTAVSETTTDIFLESAFFSPVPIAGKARRYGLHTDSSHRFERGVDPTLQRCALERATALICEHAGGQPGPVVEACDETALPTKSPILLRKARIKRVLGIELGNADVERILQKLGMKVLTENEGWSVTAPLFRFDINIEEDLIEELGRIYGYNQLPTTRFSGKDYIAPLPEATVTLHQLRNVLLGEGMNEVVTYSFIDPLDQERLSGEAEHITLANPISEEMTVMRASLWPGLIRTAQHNLKRQQDRIRLFETGLVFRKTSQSIEQTPQLAGLVIGNRFHESWNTGREKTDFYDMKGIVEQLIERTGTPYAFRFTPTEHPALHPGQSAAIIKNDIQMGWVGALHPKLQMDLDFDEKVFLFEIDLKMITMGALPSFRPLSKFPNVRRDLALVVKNSVAADEIVRCVRAVSPDLIKNIVVFDEFKGGSIEKDCKSIAIGLILQDLSRTLIDEEVDSLITRVTEQLSAQFDAKLRN
jgi:phenylalanyl-tRNA synthetase beta chain